MSMGESVCCPICGQAVAIKDHPSLAWRTMLPHDHDGELCVGTGRGLTEAREFEKRVGAQREKRIHE